MSRSRGDRSKRSAAARSAAARSAAFFLAVASSESRKPPPKMVLPSGFCESRRVARAVSERRTRKSIPRWEYLATLAAMSSSGGYAYFGLCFVFARRTTALASVAALWRSGALLMKLSPRLVTNDVLTFARFS